MYYSYFDPLHVILHTLGWVILVLAIFWLIRGFRYHRHMRMRDMWKGDKALDLLKERYAKGEISKEEFEEKRDVLDNKKQ